MILLIRFMKGFLDFNWRIFFILFIALNILHFLQNLLLLDFHFINLILLLIFIRRNIIFLSLGQKHFCFEFRFELAFRFISTSIHSVEFPEIIVEFLVGLRFLLVKFTLVLFFQSLDSGIVELGILEFRVLQFHDFKTLFVELRGF